MSRSLHSPRHLRLRALLIDVRQKAGLTQAELASRLERPQSFVSKYEGGERRIDVVEFVEICEAVGVDPVDMLRYVLR